MLLYRRPCSSSCNESSVINAYVKWCLIGCTEGRRFPVQTTCWARCLVIGQHSRRRQHPHRVNRYSHEYSDTHRPTFVVESVPFLTSHHSASLSCYIHVYWDDILRSVLNVLIGAHDRGEHWPWCKCLIVSSPHFSPRYQWSLQTSKAWREAFNNQPRTASMYRQTMQRFKENYAERHTHTDILYQWLILLY